MILKVKRGRMWLPSNKEYKNKFIEIFIKQDKNTLSFLTKITNDGRIYIPKGLREELKLGENDKVEIIRIDKLNNKERSINLIKNNYINVLAAIPKETLSKYEIIVIEKYGKYLCWYSTQGRPSEIIINKKVPLHFSRLLGYHQAEGGKPKLTKRRGRTFSFINTKIEIIKDFFKLSEDLFDKTLWNASIRYNKDAVNENELKLVRKELENLGIEKTKIRLKQGDKIRRYSILLWISNSLLSEIIENMNKKIREEINHNKNKELFENYFQAVIAGDGNFFSYRDKKGSIHSRISIYEEKEDSIKSYKEILDLYNLNGKIKRINNKNLYALTINANWMILMKILKHNIFKFAPHHYKSLIWTIKNHKKYKVLKDLHLLSKEFSIKEVKNLIAKNYSNSSHWINKRKEEGLIEFIKEGDTWKLSKKGEEIKNLLKSIE